MRRRVTAAALAAIAGAVVALAATVATYHPPSMVALEMDRALPDGTSGLFPPERQADLTFAWTRKRADVPLRGIDRRAAAACTVRLSGWRPAGTERPEVRIQSGDVVLASRTAPAGYEDIAFDVPSLPGSATLVVSIQVSQVFKPGPQDPRSLGVAIDRIACRPSGSVSSWPPTGALVGSIAAAALLGVSAAAVGGSAAVAIGAAIVVALVQAYLLSLNLAVYGAYPNTLWTLALGIGLVLVAGVAVSRRVARAPLSPQGTNTSPYLCIEGLSAAARFAWIFSAIVLFLKLAALLHPSKAPVDVFFQAHRFEWVLDGRFYFTSLTPGLYQFPYGISLYLAAAPFAWATTDYPALLRIVTCVSEAAAGLLLYLMVTRVWGDRLTGAAAVAMYHMAPISYGVIGAANLTNAFGEHLALATVAALTIASLRSPVSLSVLTIGALAALAFVSHFGTCALLGTTVFAIASLYRIGGPAMRKPSQAVYAALAVGVVLATVGYYGHFWSVYEAQVSRVLSESRGTSPGASRSQPQADSVEASEFEADLQDLDPGALAVQRRQASERTTARRNRPLAVRLGTAIGRASRPFGTPLLLLAAAGLVWLVRARRRDRLVLAVAGWGAMCFVFILLGIFTPIRMRYFFAAVPAVALLAGGGGTWLWRAGRWGQVTAVALLAWSLSGATQAWLRWLEV